MRILALFPVLAVFCVCMFLSSPPATAQTQTGAQPQDSASGHKAPPETNPEYLAEMDRIYSICTGSSFYSTYYDCKCQAVKFLDQRIKLGPDLPPDSIMMNVNTECANVPGLAGYAYNLCTEKLSLLNYKDKDFAPFCECFANKFAKTYAKNPRLSSRNVQVLQTDAYRECGFADLHN